MKNILLNLTLGLSIFFSFTYANADALNPRQKRHSIYYLSQTYVGQRLITTSVGSLNKLYDHYFIGDVDSSNQLYSLRLNSSKAQIIVTGNLLESSPKYISWVLAQAITELKVAKILQKHKVNNLPHFIEKSQWALNIATKHWIELGSPNNEDYVLDPREHIAQYPKKMQASVSYFDQLKKDDQNSFLTAVANRHIALGYDNISIHYFIANSNQRAEVNAAKELLNIMDLN